MAEKIALVGIGKIAVDQHIPAITASKEWTLAATVSRSATVEGVEGFADIDAMLAAWPDINVVSLCLPPQPRFAYAEACLQAGRHVMLEKPPGQTIAEVQALEALATSKGVTLYATWHSRAAKGVAAAKAWLSDKAVQRAHITWREDVRKWHPDQDWVFEPGGMGVFDPGINALSILTEILPQPVHLVGAELSFPANRDTPIAADLRFSGGVTAEFDWRQQGPQSWNIDVATVAGTVQLRDGGNRMMIDGNPVVGGDLDEYPTLYAQMARCLRAGVSDVDLSPMVHVADAFSLGKRQEVEPFHF